MNTVKVEEFSPEVLARTCVILGAEETVYQTIFPITDFATTIPKGSWVTIGHRKYRDRVFATVKPSYSYVQILPSLLHRD
jgi:hypothetical protein